ncbi:MAG: TetR/AcrR family transcriptional regulator [Solirubrobacteraceae bacterium]
MRDADRSRKAILAAAEAVFAQRGYDGTGLAVIATKAGVARATPTYFFGSKRSLYEAVLERATTAREAALRDAFAPIRSWAAGDAPAAALRDALRAAVGAYLAFLDRNPSFARLIAWEAQSGAQALAYGGAHATAVADALSAVHAVRRERGLPDFDPGLVSVALVSMCFLPVAHRDTFRASGGIDTADADFRLEYAELVTKAIGGLVTGRSSS